MARTRIFADSQFPQLFPGVFTWQYAGDARDVSYPVICFVSRNDPVSPVMVEPGPSNRQDDPTAAAFASSSRPRGISRSRTQSRNPSRYLRYLCRIAHTDSGTALNTFEDVAGSCCDIKGFGCVVSAEKISRCKDVSSGFTIVGDLAKIFTIANVCAGVGSVSVAIHP